MEWGCRSDTLQLPWVVFDALLVLQQAELQDATEAAAKFLANVPTLLACGECLDMVVRVLAAALGALAWRSVTLVSLRSARNAPTAAASPLALSHVGTGGWCCMVLAC